ncbi:hypothetical protein O3P69_016827 [Scylla paramamosain]|uniref:Uncharacterized protein n=1 Tax=Scylla paramamosain TaxID=85552 RepID=A0AAW0SZS6_SCYPA
MRSCCRNERGVTGIYEALMRDLCPAVIEEVIVSNTGPLPLPVPANLHLVHVSPRGRRFQVLTPPDGQWGGPLPDGNVSGIIGQVARREAHLAICEITITGSRETVVDFTSPYYLEATTMVSPAPALRSRIFAIFSPFTYQVWVCIAAATLAVGPVAFILATLMDAYVSPLPSRRGPHEYSFHMFRNLVVQTNLIKTSELPHRILFISWILFCFYVCALYSGTLTAVLAAPSYEPTVDSLQDLPRAVRQGYTLGMIKDTSMMFLFKEAKEGIYREVWQLFDHSAESQSFFRDPFSGFDKILQRRLVMFFPSLNGELQAIYRGRQRYYFAPTTSTRRRMAWRASGALLSWPSSVRCEYQ